MRTVQVYCPVCRRETEAQEEQIGKVINCPTCNNFLPVLLSQRQAPSSPETPAKVALVAHLPVFQKQQEKKTVLQDVPLANSVEPERIVSPPPVLNDLPEPETKPPTRQAMAPAEQLNSLPPVEQDARFEKASFVVGLIALCFAALAAVWSFLGGACCGWASWGWAFIGLVLSIVSLVMKRSKIGWWALGLAIFAFVWVFLSPILLAGAVAGAVHHGLH